MEERFCGMTNKESRWIHERKRKSIHRVERTLLKTQGRTWDGVPLPKLSVKDLKQDAIQLFKDKAVKRGRLTKEEVSVPDDILMDNLHLIDED